MNKIQQQVEEFHRSFGVPVRKGPTLCTETESGLRIDLIEEELEELKAAIEAGDIVEIADAFGDLLYVTFGGCSTYGLDAEPLVDEIHRSNMSKLGADGKPVKRHDGKVLKGPDFFEPNIQKVLTEMEKKR